MTAILSHKEKSVYFMKDVDEVRAINEIEVNLSQEKIEFINDAYQKELHYWKKAALESVLTENRRKQLTDLAPDAKNVHEIILNLNSRYLPHHKEQRTFMQDIPSQEDISSFEAITDYLKTFSKSIN